MLRQGGRLKIFPTERRQTSESCQACPDVLCLWLQPRAERLVGPGRRMRRRRRRRRRRRSIRSKAAKSGFYLHRTRRRQGHRCSRFRRGNRPSTRRSVGRGSYIALCTLLFSFAVLGVTWVVLHVCSIFFHFGSERSDRQAIAIQMSLVIILISKL